MRFIGVWFAFLVRPVLAKPPAVSCRHLFRIALLVAAAHVAAAPVGEDGRGEQSVGQGQSAGVDERSFGEDVEFLNEHVETLVLADPSRTAMVAVTPAYQGRVMTSTAGGDSGLSFGWINYAHIASHEVAEHINVYGGEERFWLGPEGGQFSIFFPPGARFELADWQTPPLIDTESFAVTQRSDTKLAFSKEAKLTNYSDTEFELRIDREIALLDEVSVKNSLRVRLGELEFVAYRTTNKVTNTGEQAWTKQSGLLSIWMLGMYKPGPQTTIVIPFRQGSEAELGPLVNDKYFGKVPAKRLKIGDGVIYMSGDGAYRSKIGVSPRRATPICGSYDAQRGVLTLVKYDKPKAATDYVNSMWELQDKPFAGDTVNAYNDGPPEPGVPPLGPFYELETSSPALALAPGESGEHVSETYHFTGQQAALDHLARETLGVSLDQIRSGLKPME